MNPINSIGATLVNTFNSIISFIPQFISGLIILIVGIIVASIVKAIVEKGAEKLHVGKWLHSARIEGENTTKIWVNVLSQVVYWFILLSFLIPTFEAWQLPDITNILNRFVLYLPNVFAAVVIGLAGIIVANISSYAIMGVERAISKRAVTILATVTRYAIIFFTALLALNQLGISPNLIQILLAGFVATFAIAIGLGLGLSIGLGGRETVRHTLDTMAASNRLIGAKGGATKRTTNHAEENGNKKTKKGPSREFPKSK